MAESKKSGRHSPFSFMVALALSAIATLPAARVLAQENLAVGSLNETKPAEVRVVSREFRFSPAMAWVAAGRAVTLVLDNSAGETEHDLFLPALGFRLQAKAGQIIRKDTVFEKPGKYEYICDLPGHPDAGMKGTLIVVDR
jgi:plastocyanin